MAINDYYDIGFQMMKFLWWFKSCEM